MSGPLKDAAEVHEDSLGAQVSLKAPTFTCKARSGGDPAEVAELVRDACAMFGAEFVCTRGTLQ